MRRLAACTLTLLWGFYCLGAEPYAPNRGDPLTESWRWRTFPELNGLGAQCMADGPDGTIWFGTSEGIWAFDGVNWTYHSSDDMFGGNVLSVRATPDGSLYAGGRFGLSRFHAGGWTRPFPDQGQSFGEVRKIITTQDGTLWAATAWGAVRWQAGKWTVFTGPDVVTRVIQALGRLPGEAILLPDLVYAKSRDSSLPVVRHDFAAIAEDSAGRIWLGTTGGEVLCLDPATNTWTIHNEADGMVCGRRPVILALQDGSVWVAYGIDSNHVNVVADGAWTTFRLADVGAPDNCGDLLQTRDGVVWISGRYAIAARRSGRWHTYEKPAFPIPTAINFLLESADGALWIAGPSTEIQRIDYETGRWLTLPDLNFHWESPSGAQWFLHRSGDIVVHEDDRWLRYSVADGLIDAPVALVGRSNGEVWVAGSHGNVAATARFAGGSWTRLVHDELSWGVDWRGVLASSDSSLWFSAAVDSSGPKEHRQGILQFRDGQWIHHHQPGRAPREGNDDDPGSLLPATQRPEPIGKFLSLGESPDGRIWAGRNVMIYRDAAGWHNFTPPEPLRFVIVEAMLTTRERELWIGTRQFGALRYDGHSWSHFHGKDSLVTNGVRSLVETTDGTIWAATDHGFSRFDGQTWNDSVLPAALLVPTEGGQLKAAPSGGLWISHVAPDWNRRAWSKAARVDLATCEFWTRRFVFTAKPPETRVTTRLTEVSQPGNISIAWTGDAPWRDAKDGQLQFSFRLDDGPWSAFTSAREHAFFTLPGGRHRLEVRARDRDFNVDPTPARLDFVVLPPVRQQAWFRALMALVTVALLALGIGVWLEHSRLRRANRVLATEVTERKQAEEELRLSRGSALHLTEQLTKLQGITQQLALAGSTEELCRHAVELGRSQLGFDRASIWFIDEPGGRMTGSYGTDEHGTLRDEREAQVAFRRDGSAWEIFSRKQPVARVAHCVLHDHTGSPVGKGDNAMAALWDGDAVIGIISVDNLLTRQSIDQPQLEILRLYATAIGHLVTRMRVEDALRKAERDFRTLAENSPDVIIRYDRDGRRAYVNPAFERELGIPPAQAVGRPAGDAWLAEVPAHDYRARLQQTLQNGTTNDVLVRWPDPRGVHVATYNVRIAPEWNDRREIVGALAIGRNIHALLEAERKLHTLLDNIPDLISRYDPDGTITYVNPAITRAFDRPAEHFLGRRLVDPEIPGDAEIREQLQQHIAEVFATGAAQVFELLSPQPAGARVVEQRYLPEVDTNGDVVGVLAISRDVTERKRAEEEIRAINATLEQRVQERTGQLQAANRELEAFSYSVSHDLRAPLRSIDGFSRIILEDYADKLDDEGRDHLQRVRRATQRMGTLIDDMLKLSRTARAELRRVPVDLSALAREIAGELQATDAPREVAWVVAPDLTARADRSLLRVVLENLLGNAWKFSRPQPHARIEVGRQATTPHGPAFFVRDNGAGFDMAHAARLFEPFKRLHSMEEFPGSGVGLATVLRIINRHGGRIWSESKPGEGAVFFFTLPEENDAS